MQICTCIFFYCMRMCVYVVYVLGNVNIYLIYAHLNIYAYIYIQCICKCQYVMVCVCVHRYYKRFHNCLILMIQEIRLVMES